MGYCSRFRLFLSKLSVYMTIPYFNITRSLILVKPVYHMTKYCKPVSRKDISAIAENFLLHHWAVLPSVRVTAPNILSSRTFSWKLLSLHEHQPVVARSSTITRCRSGYFQDAEAAIFKLQRCNFRWYPRVSNDTHFTPNPGMVWYSTQSLVDHRLSHSSRAAIPTGILLHMVGR